MPGANQSLPELVCSEPISYIFTHQRAGLFAASSGPHVPLCTPHRTCTVPGVGGRQTSRQHRRPPALGVTASAMLNNQGRLTASRPRNKQAVLVRHGAVPALMPIQGLIDSHVHLLPGAWPWARRSSGKSSPGRGFRVWWRSPPPGSSQGAGCSGAAGWRQAGEGPCPILPGSMR